MNRDESHGQADPDYSQGLPDHHNPLGGLGGTPRAYSALTLRLVLASFGCVLALAGVVVAIGVDAAAWVVVAFVVVAVLAAANIAVVARRKLRGEPG